MEPVHLDEPVLCSDDGDEVDRIWHLTGVMSHDGVYTEGFSFTPMLACDRMNPEQARLDYRRHRPFAFLCPNPYMVNYQKNGSVRHDMLISPAKAADIIETGLGDIVIDRSGKDVREGVVSACVNVVLKNPVSKDKVYAGSRMYSNEDIEYMYPYTGQPYYGSPPSKTLVNSQVFHPAYLYGSDGIDSVMAHGIKKGMARDVTILSKKDMEQMCIMPQYAPFDRERHDFFVKMSVYEVDRRLKLDSKLPGGRSDGGGRDAGDDDDDILFF